MARAEHVIAAAPEDAFAVLADGWPYSDWVVGRAHIRDVNVGWPTPGSRIHPEAGPWPLSLHEGTMSLVCEAPARLVPRLRLWPFGEAARRLRPQRIWNYR